MADPGKRWRLIPSMMNRERTIVLVVLIVAVAIIIIVVALSLATSPSSNKGGNNVPPGAGYSTPPRSTGPAANVKVDGFTFDQNTTTGVTTFFVTVTNNVSSSLTMNVTVIVGQSPGVTPPNQPYPSRETPTVNAALTNSTTITLAPNETRTVPVAVNTPPGFAVNPGNIVITVT